MAVDGDPSGAPETCTPDAVAGTLNDLVSAVTTGDQAGAEGLLSEVEGGSGVAAELISAYGPSAPAPLTWALLTYDADPADVGLALSTSAGGGGPEGAFGCAGGVITTLAGG